MTAQHMDYDKIIATLDLHALLEERERLNRVIDAAAKEWLALGDDHPIPFEGGVDGAMNAACAEIRSLRQERDRMRKALETILIQTDLRHTTYDFRLDANRNFKALEFIENTARAALNPKAQEPGT